MAEYVEQVMEGRLVRVYDSGLVRDAVTGHIVKPAPGNMITAENATEYHRKRQEKTRSRLRERITEETQGLSRLPVNDSSEAVAEAGAMLWADVVLNSDAYHRDRLDAFKELGRLTGDIADPKDKDTDTDKNRGVLAALGREAVAAFIEQRKRARLESEVDE